MATEHATLRTSNDITARSEQDLSRLLGWVRAAESRIAVVLPISTAMLGALAVLAPPVDSWSVAAGVATGFATILLLLSLVFSAFSAFPRTTGPKGSLIYFGGIVAWDLGQYEHAIRARSDDDYLVDLVRQCHRNAQIANSKYAWAQRAMACTFLGALPWVVALFLLYSTR